MGYLDIYKNRVNVDGATIREKILSQGMENFEQYLNSSPTKFDVNINGMPVEVIVNSISENDTEKDTNTKIIMSKLVDTINLGSVVDWDSQSWLVVDKDYKVLSTYNKVYMLPCNYTLKWLNQSGAIKETPCLTTNKSTITISSSSFMLLPDGKMLVVIPSNINTELIDINQRFIIGKNAWKVINIDTTKEGLIQLMMLEELVNEGIDDLENKVANSNISPISLIISERVLDIHSGNSAQLTCLVKENGLIVNKALVWVSLNEAIATVDNTGFVQAVSEGATEVYISLVDNSNIITKVDINVTSIISNNVQLNIIGNDYVASGLSKEFIIKKINNGIEIPTNFNFEINYMNNDSKICKLDIINASTCKITANKLNIYGLIKLKAVNQLDSTEYVEKEIEIKSLVSR